jgi:hypothetical protein
MYGRITKYRNEIGAGVIVADDGRKFRFTEADVVNRAAELVGLGVDFLLVDNRPKDIIVMAGSPWTAFGGTLAAPVAPRRFVRPVGNSTKASRAQRPIALNIAA